MNNPIIYLFCQYFPYKGGEQFLFNESEFFPANSEIIVYTQYTGRQTSLTLPPNFKTDQFKFDKLLSFRSIIRSYWKLILEVFMKELIFSPNRFKYIRHFKTYFLFLLGYIQKAKFIEEQLPQNRVLKFYSYWFDEWATLIHLVKKISEKQIDIICRMHGYDFDEDQEIEFGYHLFRYFDLKGFDKVISVSEYGRQYVYNRYHFKETEVSRLGVRNKGDNPLQAGNIKTIVSCSALIPLKRVNLIIQLLKETKLNIKWIHFGTGPLEERLLKEVKSLPENINTDFKGQTNNEDILSFYKNNSVDLFINVSELEGIPVSIMEAISFGIPVVGCKVCGVPEIVNEQTGLLLEKDFNIAEAAIEIQKFLEGKSSDLDFRKGVKDFWNNNFNADRNYPEFVEKYLLN